MAQHLIKIIGKQKLILFFWHYQNKLLAFRGTNRKTSVKVDDTLALSQLSEEFLKLIIYSRPNLASLLTLELTGVWLRVRPVCSGEVWWGPRSNSTVVQETNVYFMKVPSLVWHPGDKFFFWLFLKMTFSIIIIIFDFNSSFCSFSDIELEKELYEDMKEENYELSERN